MSDLIIRLMLAHLAGDFIFQQDKWVKSKTEQKHKSPYLYLHIGVHLILTLLLLGFDFHYWLGIITITVSHYVIDLGKLLLNKKVNKRWLFIGDQLLHILVILLVAFSYSHFKISSIPTEFKSSVLLFITAIVAVTQVSSIVIKILISKWKQEKESANDAGKYIGILERLFVFGFVITNHWEGIGFLLAAKSIFRFGDLTKAKDRFLTEYILIGTLLSFGLAICCAMLYLFIESYI